MNPDCRPEDGIGRRHPIWQMPRTAGLTGLLAAIVAATVLSGCRPESGYPNRPIVLICPWAAGGGTDRCSRQVAAMLEQELGVPVNVINATGGAGVTGHTRGALAKPDGYTVTMVTVEIYMLHWRGLTNISYQDYRPVARLNVDAAAVFVRSDAPWERLERLNEHIREHPGELTASGTASGGIWHLAFAGLLDNAGMSPADVIWVSINGSAPSLQELLAGGVDVVCCSLPEAQSLLDADRVRCLGVMADERVEQFPDVPTFKEQGIDWQMSGWRGICVPKDTPPEIADRLTEALAAVAQSDGYQDFMQTAGFHAEFQTPDEFARSLHDVDEQLGGLLTSEAFRSVQETPIGPMFFPTLLGVSLTIAVVGLIATGGLRRQAEVGPLCRGDLLRCGEVVAWVLAYLLVAETAGFVIASAVLLTIWMWRLGVRPLVSIVVGVPVAVATYQLFAVLLHVPLPRGWLGW